MTLKQPLPYYLSKGISYILHPFLIPAYVMLVLFATDMIPVYLTPRMRNYVLGVVLINTIGIPAIAIILMRLLGVIKDYSLSTRHDRMLPLFVVALCYGLGAWIIGGLPVVFLLKRFMLAAMACVIFAFALNTVWQVSLHMTAMGGAVGIISILLYGGYDSLIWIFCIAVLLAGALGSARLYLGKHTPAQVAVGFFGGMLISIAVLLFVN